MDALQDLAIADGGAPEASLHYGAYQMALLKHNITGWAGPAFQGVPCTAAMIERLDPDEPLVQRTLEEIGRLNPLRKETPAEKKDDTSAGDPSSEAIVLSPDTGTST